MQLGINSKATRSLFLFTIVGFSPALFSSCASKANTAGSNALGASLPSQAYYNPATGEFNDKWPYGPNTYR
jgi:hypothetical protein